MCQSSENNINTLEILKYDLSEMNLLPLHFFKNNALKILLNNGVLKIWKFENTYISILVVFF